MFTTSDTIVALATPPGRGGLGVIRLSGPQAVTIAHTLLGRVSALTPRQVIVGRVRDVEADGRRTVDEVVVTWFAAPRSYTGEDVVEISAHGSPVVLRRILDLAVRGGARIAEPGEFTLRAHLNDRLDLIQAEAVLDLVDAVTPLQARAAMDQLEGTLTARIADIDGALFDLIARLEASIDFPDEGFHFVTRESTARELEGVRESLRTLQRDGRAGRMLRDGGLVVIAGRPNAGKSSLFNALLGAARAIVTEVPGTTRDTLTERVDIGGMPVTLVDTAGQRDTVDPIEAEGVRRARAAQAVATLTLVVLDRSAPVTADDRRLLRSCDPCLVVVNKSDLAAAWPVETLGELGQAPAFVSAVTGAGLGELRDQMVTAMTGREEWRDPPAVTNLRHLALIDRSVVTLDRVLSLLQAGATEELILAELSETRGLLEEVTGRRAPDDVLRHIFSRFCIGK